MFENVITEYQGMFENVITELPGDVWEITRITGWCLKLHLPSYRMMFENVITEFPDDVWDSTWLTLVIQIVLTDPEIKPICGIPSRPLIGASPVFHQYLVDIWQMSYRNRYHSAIRCRMRLSAVKKWWETVWPSLFSFKYSSCLSTKYYESPCHVTPCHVTKMTRKRYYIMQESNYSQEGNMPSF